MRRRSTSSARARRTVIDRADGTFEIATARRRFAGFAIDFALLQLAAFAVAAVAAAAGSQQLVPFSPFADPSAETLRETTRTLDDGTVATERLHVRREDTFGLWPRAWLVESTVIGVGGVGGDGGDGDGGAERRPVRVTKTTVHPATLAPMRIVDSNELTFLLLPVMLLIIDVVPRRLSPARRWLGLEVRRRNGAPTGGRDRLARGAAKALPFALIAMLIAWPAMDQVLRPWSFALIVLPFAAFAVMAMVRRRAALHDLVAGTVVVRQPSALPGPGNRL